MLANDILASHIAYKARWDGQGTMLWDAWPVSVCSRNRINRLRCSISMGAQPSMGSSHQWGTHHQWVKPPMVQTAQCYGVTMKLPPYTTNIGFVGLPSLQQTWYFPTEIFLKQSSTTLQVARHNIPNLGHKIKSID